MYLSHIPTSQKLCAALACLHVRDLVRRSSLEAGRTREKKGGEKRRNERNPAWQFGNGKLKCRWRARVYPERENQEFYHSRAFGTVKARWVSAVAVARYYRLGDAPSARSSRWPSLRGGVDACFNNCYAACACGIKSPAWASGGPASEAGI